MDKDKQKYLTDEEFFTFVKFRDLMLRDGHFALGDISLDKNVDNIYNRISNACGDWLDDLPVHVTKGETFGADLEELREKASDNPTPYKEKDYKLILDKLEKTEWIKFAEVGIISWI